MPLADSEDSSGDEMTKYCQFRGCGHATQVLWVQVFAHRLLSSDTIGRPARIAPNHSAHRRRIGGVLLNALYVDLPSRTLRTQTEIECWIVTYSMP